MLTEVANGGLATALDLGETLRSGADLPDLVVTASSLRFAISIGLRTRRGQPSQSTSARHEHADLSPIAAVAIAELGDEVAFFEPDANEDVAGGPDREQ